MACLITDKIEFDLVPPTLTLASPTQLLYRPSVSDAVCAPPGMQFSARFTNVQSDKLVMRTFVGDRMVRFDESVPGDSGLLSPCVDFRDLGGEGDSPLPGCYVVRMLVSHGFVGNDRNADQPIVPGDVASVTWYVGVEPVEDDPDAEDGDLFRSCLDKLGGPNDPTITASEAGVLP